MKDAAHHIRRIQKKVVQESRKQDSSWTKFPIKTKEGLDRKEAQSLGQSRRS